MSSFFSRIQSKFSASFGGRYVETIIKEISINESEITRVLFPKIRTKGYIETEYRFSVNDKVKIADIALFSIDTDNLLALAEIKYDDHNDQKNSAQLEDYVEYSMEKEVDFLYLTQYYPPASDIEMVRNSGFTHLLFSEISEKMMARGGPLTNLFIDYLKDRGLVMEIVPSEQLYKLLVRFFNPIRGQKVQRNRDMVQNIPDAFSSLFTNMSVITQELGRHFGTNRSPAIDFTLKPSYEMPRPRINSMYEQPEKGVVRYFPELKEKDGGELLVFARSKLPNKHKKDNYTYIKFGFIFSIERASIDYKSNLFVDIYGRDLFGLHSCKKKIGNSIVSDKKKCLSHFKALLTGAVESAIVDDGIRKNQALYLKKVRDSIDLE